MKKISIVLSALLGLLLAAGIFWTIGNKRNESVQAHTETEPIYHHFPALPEASDIQWRGGSSDGIGLTTTKIYIFAFYDHDMSDELQGMEVGSAAEDIELYFIPDGMNMNQKWRYVENASFAFQTGIKSAQKMNTTVYINDERNILYIEAIGD